MHCALNPGEKAVEMKTRIYVGIYLTSLLILVGIAWLERSPGYMDADYYYAAGLRIATEKSWQEPYLWNYLAEQDSLPVPAFTYWMPAAGILSGMGITLTGSGDFWSARIFFLLSAAGVAPLTAYMAYTFKPKRWAAVLAGALAIFAGFYMVYLPTTDTFAIYMLMGGGIFLLIRRFQQDLKKRLELQVQGESANSRFISPLWIYLIAGLTAGLLYMTRADGLIWLLLVMAAIILQLIQFHGGKSSKDTLGSAGYWLPVLLSLGAFLVVCIPWMGRNFELFGTIFAPGSGKALWITRYDELFAFPASAITPTAWAAQGLLSIVQARTWALGINSGSILAVQGGIFLLPLSLAGMWAWRKDWRVLLGVWGWLFLFIVMSLVFPFQGARGGFFHAGAGFQVLIWSLVPVGLDKFVAWGQRKRGWLQESAVVKFGVGLITLTILLTGFLSWQKLIGSAAANQAWGAKFEAYKQVEGFLRDEDVSSEHIVMVNNPPGFYAAVKRPSIVIPDGGLEAVEKAAEKFNARYLVIDEDFPQGMQTLYQEPGSIPGLQYWRSISDMHLYVITP